MAATTDYRIVIIDDHVDHLCYIETLLKRAGYRVVAFDRARKALDYIAHEPVALVITDLFMPDMDGIEVVRSLKQKQPAPAVIGISGGVSDQALPLLKAMSALGAHTVLSKPIDGPTLLSTVANIHNRV